MKLLTRTYILLLTLVSMTQVGALTIDEVTNASYTDDIAAMEAMLDSSNERDGNEDGYENAYLKYRLAVAYYAQGKEAKSDNLLAETVNDLKAYLDTSPDSAEAHALISTAIGMRISLRPATRGMLMGPASGRAVKQAIQLDPVNPRAWMIKGIAAHNTPVLFGGGNKKALDALNKALELYSQEYTGWGHADAYVWRGLTYQSMGDRDKAREDFQAALDASPNFNWARHLLAELDNNPAGE